MKKKAGGPNFIAIFFRALMTFFFLAGNFLFYFTFIYIYIYIYIYIIYRPRIITKIFCEKKITPDF